MHFGKMKMQSKNKFIFIWRKEVKGKRFTVEALQTEPQY